MVAAVKYEPYIQGQVSALFNLFGTTDTVKSVGFYHGGDVIYTLERASGVWHEQLLSPHDGVGDGGISREGE